MDTKNIGMILALHKIGVLAGGFGFGLQLRVFTPLRARPVLLLHLTGYLEVCVLVLSDIGHDTPIRLLSSLSSPREERKTLFNTYHFPQTHLLDRPSCASMSHPTGAYVYLPYPSVASAPPRSHGAYRSTNPHAGRYPLLCFTRVLHADVLSLHVGPSTANGNSRYRSDCADAWFRRCRQLDQLGTQSAARSLDVRRRCLAIASALPLALY